MRCKKPKLTEITLRLFIISLLTAGLAASCSSKQLTPTSTPTSTPQEATETPSNPTMTPTKQPTATPTLPPAGEPGNPITIGFVLAQDQTDALEAVEDLVFLMNEKSGISFEFRHLSRFSKLIIFCHQRKRGPVLAGTAGISLFERAGCGTGCVDDQSPWCLCLRRPVHDKH